MADAERALTTWGGFHSVTVASGHVTDAPDRATPRFPERMGAAISTLVRASLEDRGVGTDHLLICGGARGGDLIAAEAALELGATVWLLLAHPADQFEHTSVAGSDPRWVARFWSTVQRAPSWVIPRDRVGDENVYTATNTWMLDVAGFQSTGPTQLIVVWDGKPAAHPGGTADIVAQSRRADADVVVIDPLRGDVRSSSLD